MEEGQSLASPESLESAENGLERPRQVITAFWLVVASVVIGFVSTLIFAFLLADTLPAPGPVGFFALVSMGFVWVGARAAAGRNWARWLIVAYLGLSIFGLCAFFGLSWTALEVAEGVFYVAQLLPLLAAAILLFKEPASSWFGSISTEEKATKEVAREAVIAARKQAYADRPGGSWAEESTKQIRYFLVGIGAGAVVLLAAGAFLWQSGIPNELLQLLSPFVVLGAFLGGWISLLIGNVAGRFAKPGKLLLLAATLVTSACGVVYLFITALALI